MATAASTPALRLAITRDRLLQVIAAWKLVRGVALLVAGGLLLKLGHTRVVDLLLHLAGMLHVNLSANPHLQALMEDLMNLRPHTVLAIGIGLLTYAVKYLVEGVGLLLDQTWAEYLTVITTSLLVPVEFVEILRSAHLAKVGILVVNLLVVWYLIRRLKQKLAQRRQRESECRIQKGS